MKVAFVVASHKPEVLEKNLLASPFFEKMRKENAEEMVPVVVQTGYTCVAKAYNDAAKNPLVAEASYVVYVHHDVVLPEDWGDNFLSSLLRVQAINGINDKNWGVLGVAGVRMEEDYSYRKAMYGHLDDRGMEWGKSEGLPISVTTLDEVLLITKGAVTTFDENLDREHFFGADLCMQMIEEGRKNYAIDAYIHHNSDLLVGERDEVFWKSKKYMQNKWKGYLPIPTTCTII